MNNKFKTAFQHIQQYIMQRLSWTTFILERLFRVMHIFHKMSSLLIKEDCAFCWRHFCLISSELIGRGYINSNCVLNWNCFFKLLIQQKSECFDIHLCCSNGDHPGEIMRHLENLYLFFLTTSEVHSLPKLYINCTHA